MYYRNATYTAYACAEIYAGRYTDYIGLTCILSIPLPLAADNPIVNPVQNCCLPSIQSINALLLPKEDNGNMCANVTWNEVPGDCEILQWRLALLEWDGIPSYDFADDGNQTNYYEVVSRSWVIVCGLTTTKYYQFQLSTTVQTYNTSLKFGSHTHFFGNSSEFIGCTHIHTSFCQYCMLV